MAKMPLLYHTTQARTERNTKKSPAVKTAATSSPNRPAPVEALVREGGRCAFVAAILIARHDFYSVAQGLPVKQQSARRRPGPSAGAGKSRR